MRQRYLHLQHSNTGRFCLRPARPCRRPQQTPSASFTRHPQPSSVGPRRSRRSPRQHCEAMASTTTRLAGTDRWATSAAVATRAVTEGMSGPPWLASGANWPDAVSAGPAAAAGKGVLLLVAPSDLAGSPASQAWLAAHPVHQCRGHRRSRRRVSERRLRGPHRLTSALWNRRVSRCRQSLGAFLSVQPLTADVVERASRLTRAIRLPVRRVPVHA